MERYLKLDEWKIIEEGFMPENQRKSESLFSIGNGRMGQRANFEEKYSGDSLQGSYVGGVYYPDKTRVGWWKNGYPEYFAKVINSANWIGINVWINTIELDLATCEVLNFTRILNMKEGTLERICRVKLQDGNIVRINAIRFISFNNHETGAIKYALTPENFSGEIILEPYIDFDVKNEDANYDEKFWKEVKRSISNGEGFVISKTKKLDFQVSAGMKIVVGDNNSVVNTELAEGHQYISNKLKVNCVENEQVVLYKYATVLSSLNHSPDQLETNTVESLNRSFHKGFDELLDDHRRAWSKKWEECDIVIDGDVAAQQAIRFNIFQLYQTYTGDDERLNIGPKGFTGEKYGGSTYWDTEAYCLPFYLSTADQKIARNLLLYRYKHLKKAIENAEKLGFKDGAALYPMVTMNGEECHNEWEITFEEIHRNGAIAYAIHNYVTYTGDTRYLVDHGLEVLIALSRFWSQRAHFSDIKKKYVILGVTGPNEYENNVNNNWYTNKIATWTLKFTIDTIEFVKNQDVGQFQNLELKTGFDEKKEISWWREIIKDMYFPYDKERNVFLQQEGYLDKEQRTSEDINPEERPLNQHWSWDRILRSCFIKQADVLQGIYWFEEEYDTETIRQNFDFYESRTVHESSLSPCVHSILASRVGNRDKAYKLYLRTARLDLDDYNNEVAEGCHITSMAGTWMTIIQGFSGMRVMDNMLTFKPYIPDLWMSYSFKLKFRGRLLFIQIHKNHVNIQILQGNGLRIKVYDKFHELSVENGLNTSLIQDFL